MFVSVHLFMCVCVFVCVFVCLTVLESVKSVLYEYWKDDLSALEYAYARRFRWISFSKIVRLLMYCSVLASITPNTYESFIFRL